MDLIQLILRSLQLIFLAIVLGLTGGLVADQAVGGSPASTNYVLACGVLGALVMIVGFVAVFVGRLQGLVMVVLDGLAVVFFIAGSVVYAVKLGVHSCGNARYHLNPITNGGSTVSTSGTYRYYGDSEKLCRMAQADTAFMFFALAAFIASLVMDVLDLFRVGSKGSGGKSGRRSRRRRQESVEEYE